jgi:hypothetical protein
MLELVVRAQHVVEDLEQLGGQQRRVAEAVGQHERQRALEAVVAQDARVQEAAEQRLGLGVEARLAPANV